MEDLEKEALHQTLDEFLLILLFFITPIKILSVVMVFHLQFTTVILLIIIFGGGLHFITMAWSILQQQVIFKRPIFLVSMVITSISLPLPFLGEILPWEIRIVSVTAFVVVSAFLALSMQQQTATFFFNNPHRICFTLIPYVGNAETRCSPT